jgi:hypothetical protein
MTGKRREDGRACRCDQHDVSCVGLTVGRLSSERVAELAEEIWTASTGRSCRLAPSRIRAAAAQAHLPRPQPSAARPSALQPLEQRGDLLLHDVTLPGWPAGLEHLVIGPTGVWVIRSCQHSQPPPQHTATSPWQARGATADPLPKLRWQAAVFADTLASERLLPVRLLLSVPGGRLAGRHPVKGVTVATTRQLVDVIRQGAPLPAADVEQATTRALALLRPAV